MSENHFKNFNQSDGQQHLSMRILRFLILSILRQSTTGSMNTLDPVSTVKRQDNGRDGKNKREGRGNCRWTGVRMRKSFGVQGDDNKRRDKRRPVKGTGVKDGGCTPNWFPLIGIALTIILSAWGVLFKKKKKEQTLHNKEITNQQEILLGLPLMFGSKVWLIPALWLWMCLCRCLCVCWCTPLV